VAKSVLGLLGSPLKDGNTADLLESALNGAKSAGLAVERLDLYSLRINPCLECGGCSEGATCVQEQDDMKEIYSRVRRVDAIILASPIFFMGVSAQTKAMIDRCQAYWIEKYVLKKRHYEGMERPKGLFLSCSGSPKPDIFEPATHVVRAFFAAIDYQYVGEVFLGHTDDPELMPRKKAAIEQAFEAGRKLGA
jgi:multimeric flavodoxin WrbA